MRRDGDVVAQALELMDESRAVGFGGAALREVVSSEFLVGLAIPEDVVRDDEDGMSHRDDCFLIPRRPLMRAYWAAK